MIVNNVARVLLLWDLQLKSIEKKKTQRETKAKRVKFDFVYFHYDFLTCYTLQMIWSVLYFHMGMLGWQKTKSVGKIVTRFKTFRNY